MRTYLKSNDNEAILLVDTTNAFNLLNRQAPLHNVRRLCPALATILINTYQDPTDLLIDDDLSLVSQEGTIQGDPLAMPMYSLATAPLLTSSQATAQTVCRRCSSCGQTFRHIRVVDRLTKQGPSFGYFKPPKHLAGHQKRVQYPRIQHLCPDWNVALDDRPYLGAPIALAPQVMWRTMYSSKSQIVFTHEQPCCCCRNSTTYSLFCPRPWHLK